MKKNIKSLLSSLILVISLTLSCSIFSLNATAVQVTDEATLKQALSLISKQYNGYGYGNNNKKLYDIASYLCFDSAYKPINGQKFPYINYGANALSTDTVYDPNLSSFIGTSSVYIGGNASGCFAYCRYAEVLFYGSVANTELYFPGSGGNYTADNVKQHIQKYAQVGEHIRIDACHSVTFISCDDNGFYFLEYNGDSNQLIKCFYNTYQQFATFANSYKANMKIYDVVSQTNEYFLPSEYYGYIQHIESGNYLTLNSNNNVTNNAFTGNDNQIWHFQRDSTISSIHAISSKDDYVFMGIEDISSISSTSNVKADAWNTSWAIKGTMDKCRLMPYANTAYSLDVTNNSSEPNTNIQIYDNNDTAAQYFKIIPLTSPDNGYENYNLPVPTRTLSYTAGSSYMTGSDVLWLQKAYNALGYSVDEDSIYGANTKAATQQFQTDHNLTVDGIAGEATRAKVIELLKPIGVTLVGINNDGYITVNATAVNNIPINNYNFYVIYPGTSTKVFHRGTDNKFTFASQGEGTYKVYCDINNDYGSYSGASSPVSIKVKPSITDCIVSDISNQIYTGNAIKPTPAVTYYGKTLTNGTDYTLSYSNNTNIGTATVTIKGINNYAGTKTVTFKIIPAAPTLTSATQAKGKINLSWTTVNGATSYRVYRSTSPTGTKTLLKTVGITSCEDTTATFGTTYYYFVQAYNSTKGITSAYSNYKSLKFTSLAPPTLNSVTSDGSKVTLSWSAVPNATSYRVYRGTSATGAKSLLKTVSTTSCNNTSVTAGTTYYYYVVAYSSKTGTMSAASNTKSVTIASSLSAPTLSSVTQAKGKINISWNAVSGATSYRVYRATSATGTKTLLKTVGITSCEDTTAAFGTTYYYFVQAYSSKTGTSSAYSGYKSLKFTSLAPPTLNSVTKSGNTVTLKWTAVPNATSYRVYRGTSATGAKSLLKTVGITSCNNTSVTAGTTYYYYVVAYSSKTDTMSAASNTKSIKV